MRTSPGLARGTSTSLFRSIFLAAAWLPAACSDHSLSDPLLARGEISVGSPAAPAPSRPAVVTLITGDRVQLSHASFEEPLAAIEAGPGREKVKFLARTEQNGPERDLIVVPDDAEPLLASRRLDPLLFNVSELVRQGFEDAGAPTLPLIVTYTGGPARSVSASGARPVGWLGSIQGEVVVKDKQDSGAFWRWITEGGSPGPAGPQTLATDVRGVWLDAHVPVLLEQSAPQIGAPQAWAAGLTGSGITVAVLDTGIRADHPDLTGKVLEAVDFTNTQPDASDNVGHGTHVAGIIAGTGAASGGRYRGIAPDASLIVGKVCATSSCTLSAIIAGMEWAAPRARIVNISLGGGGSNGTDPLSTSVNHLTAQHGTLFVAAAGNSGRPQTVAAPAAADAALAVASTDKSGGMSSFSSRGPRVGDHALKPDIAAPGRDIVAARARGTPSGDSAPVDDSYVRLSGTSMATPHVSGSAALLAQQHPDWKAEQLKAALMSTSRPVANASIVESGVGLVDLARAVSQRVYAVSGSVSFGVLPWPHEGPPVAKSVTYRNDGDADVTLQLTVSARAADGTPGPEGLFAADAQVTVPAHGTATAQVTMTPQPRRYGLFSLLLSASDGANNANTAGVVYQEPESYNLTILTLDRNGEAPGWTFGTVFNIHTADSKSINGPANNVTLRLPRGEYDLNLWLTGAEADIAASRPMITLDKDVSITLDGRLAVPFVVQVDRPDASLLSNSVSLHSKTVSGIGSTVLGLSDVGLYALPTQPVTGHLFSVDYRAWLGGPPAAERTPPEHDYLYNLVFPIMGGVPADLTLPVHDQELGAVQAQYHAQGDATAYRTNFGLTPDNASGYLANLPQPLPGKKLEYYTANVLWNETLSLYPPAITTPFYFERVVGRSVYLPNEQLRRHWNSAPVGPSFGPELPFWGAYRINNNIDIHLTPFSPAEKEHATFSFTGTTKISRDGMVIGSSPSAAYGRFAVPADPGTYTVEAIGTRQVPWSLLGTGFVGSWTFHSAAAADPGLHRLPLLLVRVSTHVDDHDSAPAGVPYLLGLQVQRQAGAPEAPVVSLGLEVSYDDGQTWEPAALLFSGDRGLALVDHPETPAFVSLRARAEDAAGNRVTQTVTRAYRTRRPAPPTD
jgi:subtilisin family serine protease